MKDVIRWGHPFEIIYKEHIENYFEKGEQPEDNLAQILLKEIPVALYHVNPDNPEQLKTLWSPVHPVRYHVWPELLGVNHDRCGEGIIRMGYSILVRDLSKSNGRKTSWLLPRQPEFGEKRFYLHPDAASGNNGSSFGVSMAEGSNITNVYLCRGDPSRILNELEREGFSFIKEPMGQLVKE